MEDPADEIGRLASVLDIAPLISKLNQNAVDKELPSLAFLRCLERYYRLDLGRLGY
jgi:hypothetical protein